MPNCSSPLSVALVFWVVGELNVHQSVCAARQYALSAPAAWDLVAVHRGEGRGAVSRAVQEAAAPCAVRLLLASELQARITPLAPTPRAPQYRAQEAGVVRLKLITWALVEYDRVLIVDTDVYLHAPPFGPIGCAALQYTEDVERIAGVSACGSAFNSGFLLFRPSLDVARLLLKLAAVKLRGVCEMTQTDQTVLNVFFGNHWLRLEGVAQAVHYTAPRQGEAGRAGNYTQPLVHFVGQRKPFAWFKACARRGGAEAGPRVA